MAKLTAKKRKALPDSSFALPDQRKYPDYDDSHAAAAKSRAEQQYHLGNLSKQLEQKVIRDANRELYGQSTKPGGN